MSDSGKILVGIGLVLLVVGAGIFAVAYQSDTTVTLPTATVGGTTYGGERVHNIGLLQQQHNQVLLGGGLALIGVLCALVGVLTANNAAPSRLRSMPTTFEPRRTLTHEELYTPLPPAVSPAVTKAALGFGIFLLLWLMSWWLGHIAAGP